MQLDVSPSITQDMDEKARYAFDQCVTTYANDLGIEAGLQEERERHRDGRVQITDTHVFTARDGLRHRRRRNRTLMAAQIAGYSVTTLIGLVLKWADQPLGLGCFIVLVPVGAFLVMFTLIGDSQ